MSGEEKQGESGQLENLNFLKGISIIFICFYHAISIRLTKQTILIDREKIIYFIEAIFSTGVPLLFTVNGYLMLRKKRTIKEYLQKMIVIIVLAITWAVITMLFCMMINQRALSMNQFISGLIHLKKGWINHLWFLKALVFCYVFAPVIQYLYHNKKRIFYGLFIVLCISTIGRTLLVYALNYFHGMGKDSLWFLQELSKQRGTYFTYTLSYFCLGGILYQLSMKEKKQSWKGRYVLVILIAMAIQYIYGVDQTISTGKSYDIAWEGYNSVPTFFMVLALYKLTINVTAKNRISNFICYVGQNSLGIYFLHRCIIIWGGLLVGAEISHLLLFQIGLGIVSIILSLLIIILMNKNRWTNRLISFRIRWKIE